jgi:hypothetical protein
MSGRGRVRAVAAILSGVVVVALTAAASRVPWRVTDTETAMVRFSWRVPALVLRTCEALVPAEGAQVPEHLRAQLCDGEGVPWALEVRIDGEAVIQDTVEAAGIRGDRPLYVLRNVAVEPGRHEVGVRFAPILPEEEAADSLAQRALALDAPIQLEDREVLLVTFDPEPGELVVREPVGPE